MLTLKPDFEQTRARYAAFWQCAVADRPPVCIHLPRGDAAPFPARAYASHRERWLDVDYRAEQMAHQLASTRFLGDAVPVAFPNLGPEVYSAWCGCDYEFGESTTWSQPCVHDWARDGAGVRLNTAHPLFTLLERFTRNLLALGRGAFLTGLTDFHFGGDHLAALRDPANLAVDLIESPDFVKAELAASLPEALGAYDHFYAMLRAGGSLACSWMGSLFGEGRFYIPSNDFSCLVSPAMFEEFFLEGIRAECRHYDQSIYHLDGPQALRHLDMLLQIPELDAVQWVEGTGNEGFARWAGVYRRIQAAGKALELHCTLAELPLVFEALRPEGVWFSYIQGVDCEDTANAVLKRVAAWK